MAIGRAPGLLQDASQAGTDFYSFVIKRTCWHSMAVCRPNGRNTPPAAFLAAIITTGSVLTNSKTIHVIPRDSGWAVKREGSAGTIHETKDEALEQARTVVRRSRSGQIVVHGRDGRIAEYKTYGMPKVQTPAKKSRLGTRKIEEAVSKILFDRLGSDPHPPRG